jgi:hypothetical protein
MFRKLIKNKKAQNTAEYALLISLVVAAIIAMQTYAQRALQARIRDASNYMATQTCALGTTLQYEPYYLTTNYEITRNATEEQRLGVNVVEVNSTSDRTRAANGFQSSDYSTFGLATSP